MAAPTAWQLGEELKGRLLPVLRDVKELKGKIHLEISHKQDEMEFGSVFVRPTKSPDPEDPKKMRKLGESVIKAVSEAIEMYEHLCLVEDTGVCNFYQQAEASQVSTTFVDDEESDSLQRPTPEEGPTGSPLATAFEKMDTEGAEAGFADLESSAHQRCMTDRPKLNRSLAIENEESVDLGKVTLQLPKLK